MARLAQHQLTTRNIPNLEPGKSHTDGHGLMLRVQPDGRGRSWLLRVTVGGERRVYGLGGYPDVSLREARERAAKMRERAREGLDPVPEPEPTVAPSFEAVTDSVFRLRQQSWTPQHATQWRDSLGRHVMPAIGDASVDVITTAEVLKLLEPLWTTKPETASRIRQRVAMIFDFAIAAGYRTDNPCGPALLKALPRRPRQRRHHPSLPFAEVPGVVRAIRESRARPSTRLALELIILTGARTGEVRLSTWDEIDMGAALWNVPVRAHEDAAAPPRAAVDRRAGRASPRQGLGRLDETGLPVHGTPAEQDGVHDGAPEARIPPCHGSRVQELVPRVGAREDRR